MSSDGQSTHPTLIHAAVFHPHDSPQHVYDTEDVCLTLGGFRSTFPYATCLRHSSLRLGVFPVTEIWPGCSSREFRRFGSLEAAEFCIRQGSTATYFAISYAYRLWEKTPDSRREASKVV